MLKTVLTESRQMNASFAGSVVRNLPASAGDAGVTPGSARSPEKEMTTHSGILPWEIPWTEGPEGYSSWSHKELDTT